MFLLAVAASGVASAAEFSNLPLKGIKEVQVIVGNLDDASESLTKDQILIDTELRLRKAGIKLSDYNALSTVPYLYIRVGTRRVSSGLYIDAILTQLNQKVILTRNPEMGVFSMASWNTECLGMVSSGREVRDAVGDQIDRFLNAYLDANPK
jgi:hypothetical protein